MQDDASSASSPSPAATPPLSVRTGWRSLGGLAFWIVISFCAAAFGAQFMPGAWYASLNKPSWNPPSWLFGPVWSALYSMMGIAAWLIWKRGGFPNNKAPLGWFLIQLFLNSLWSWLFFGLHNPPLAFAEIVVLWVAIAITLLQFIRRNRIAGWLLVPYLLWVSFAAFLNFTLWQLNPLIEGSTR